MEIASGFAIKCTFPTDLHLECLEKATPLVIRTEAGDIRITFQQPGQQNTVNLPAGCGLDIAFEALNGRRLHLPRQQTDIKILVPGHPIMPETNDSFNPDNADIWIANGIRSAIASPQTEQATSSTPGRLSKKQRRAEKLRDGATSVQQPSLPSSTSSS